MEMKFQEHIVFFDIDGILIVSERKKSNRRLKFISLFEEPRQILSLFAAPVGIVSHRPRREGLRILSSLGIDRKSLVACYFAEDLLRLNIINGSLADILSDGLKKRYAIIDTCKRRGIPVHNACVVDDRETIINDYESQAIGLIFYFPQTSEFDDEMLSRFDVESAAAVFQEWAESSGTRRHEGITENLYGQAVSRSQLGVRDIAIGSRVSTFETLRPVARLIRHSVRSVIRRFASNG